MPRLAIIFISAILLASAMVTWRIRCSTRVQLSEREEALRLQSVQLAAMASENERLADVAAQSQKGGSLTGEELRELLRLRGQVGLLRETAFEIDRLAATNRHYLAELAKSQANAPSELMADGHETNSSYWPRDQFAFAGFADPESALKTTLWIWVDADLDSILAHCTPEQRAQLEGLGAGTSETQLAALRKRMAAMYSLDRGGVSLMDKKQTSADEALLDLYFEGDGKRRRFSVKKLGDQWTVTGLVAIFN